MQLGDILGPNMDPSQQNLLALIVSIVLYAVFINRMKD